MVSYEVYGQLADPIFFQDKIHDFGEVLEQGAPVNFEFSFVNKSNRPIRILTVQPSCGCTTPGWTKEPVLPGKSGIIKASFDPKARPGYFNKTLSVTTDYSANVIVLQVKGNVVDSKSSKGSNDLLVENGNLRFRNSSFNIGKIYNNKPVVGVEFPVYNDGIDTVKLVKLSAPPYIKMDFPRLPPNTRGSLKLLVDAKSKKQYGFSADTITIHTTDKKQAVKTFVVYSTTEESFGVLSAEEQANAAVLSVENYQLDLGRMKDGNRVERTIKLKNKGKKELLIRHVQSNCSCLVSLAAKSILKPNEETNLNILFDSTEREGLQNKAITIYSTDPVNPVQRVLVKGYIDN